MKKGKDELGIRSVLITFFKDPFLLSKEIRIRANWYIRRGHSKRNAYSKAASEVDNVQNTQVLRVENSMDLDPIADLVAHIARGRNDYKFTSEIIR